MVHVGDTLIEKAFLALEEAAQQSRYQIVQRTYAIRFALAYLWDLNPTNRRPFDDLWRAFVIEDHRRYRAVELALKQIYWHLQIEPIKENFWRMWRQAREDGSGDAK